MPTSTINPNLPADGASLSSAVIRANFLAASNDINALYNYFETNPTFNSITGGDSSLGITGLASSGAGTGGAVAIAGGVTGALGGVGGAIAIAGGAGTGTSTGGAVSIAGGAITGLGASGNGGALTLSGGVGGGAGVGGALVLSGGSGGTVGMVTITGSAIRVGSAQTTANGSVATALSSVGPSGSHTTVQEWLVVQNSSGTARYIPLF